MKHDFNKDRDRDNIFNYLIITSSMKVINEVIDAKKDDGIYEITIQVNGVEVDAEAFVNRWQENVARQVTEAAETLIREKFVDLGDSVSEIDELVRSFETSVSKVIKDKIAAMIDSPEVEKT